MRSLTSAVVAILLAAGASRSGEQTQFARTMMSMPDTGLGGESGEDEFQVDEAEASQIALRYMQGKAPGHKHVLHKLHPFPDKSSATAIYVVQFEGGGFVVLSADRRMPPVLAHSSTNGFPVGPGVSGPSDVDYWLGQHVRRLEQLRAARARPKAAITQMWNSIQAPLMTVETSSALESSSGCTLTPILTGYVPPLLGTSWSQGCPYDLNTPNLSCSDNCGHALTGCVATATAQVLRYFQHPAGYSWSSMPASPTCNACTAETDLSRLMSDVGAAVGMNYGCNSSGADFANVRPALFHFSYYASQGSYDLNIVENEHFNGRPVLHDGFTAESCFLFWCWPSGVGHAWVSDGFERYSSCTDRSDYLHLNWGWGGAYDGYYLTFDVAGYSFTHFNSIVYNIAPIPPAPTCDPGLTYCGDSCVDTMTDSSNCSSCSNACSPGCSCIGGACYVNGSSTGCYESTGG